MQYDAIVIGAGMSGIGCALRLALMGQKVLLVEKHRIPGGLNSYYARGKRQFDVGLHALTNWRPKKLPLGQKRGPLHRLLRQLRLQYHQLQACPQNYSLIQFPQVSLRFSNDLEMLLSDVNRHFPREVDGMAKLVRRVEQFAATEVEERPYLSAKKVVRELIADPLLVDMIFCPLLYYGSAWENDMDFSQFCIMFRSLYLEGFFRPVGGVRTLLSLLEANLTEQGVDYRKGLGVEEISPGEVLLSNGERARAKHIFSSCGLAETQELLAPQSPPLLLDKGEEERPPVGKFSFVESILRTKVASDGRDPFASCPASIVFFCNNHQFSYQKPVEKFCAQSGVLCFPHHFQNQDISEDRPGAPLEATARVTFMANFSQWSQLGAGEYKLQKREVEQQAKQVVAQFCPDWSGEVSFKDVFTPKTIKRYTGHLGGTVYGSPRKVPSGMTAVPGLYIIGTDQGFLGVIGSLLSGITMANIHGAPVSGGAK